jgi:hypothetical protein
VPTGYPTQSEFREAVGAAFTVAGGSLAEGDRLELVLAEVRSDETGDDRRFSLEFRGPLEPQLPQATYAFERDGATLEIFIVPVERDDSGVIYEAVFA